MAMSKPCVVWVVPRSQTQFGNARFVLVFVNRMLQRPTHYNKIPYLSIIRCFINFYQVLICLQKNAHLFQNILRDKVNILHKFSPI